MFGEVRAPVKVLCVIGHDDPFSRNSASRVNKAFQRAFQKGMLALIAAPGTVRSCRYSGGLLDSGYA